MGSRAVPRAAGRPAAVRAGQPAHPAILAGSVVVAITLISRLAAVWFAGGFHEGETDSALFSLGVWRWAHGGPRATLIYDARFSAGYYWLAAEWTRWRHIPLAHITSFLDSISLAAAVATAVIAYALARRFVSPAAALWSSVVFLVVPGVWMLSLESHPQGLGLCLALLAFYLALPGNAGVPPAALRYAAFGLVLTATLLVRSDAVFLFPAFLLLPVLPPVGRWCRWRRCIPMLACLGAASVAYLLVRRVLLGEAVGASEATSWHRIAGFVGQLSPLRQLLPVVMGLGPLVCLVALAGIALCWRHGNRLALAWILVLSMPGTVFWLLIRGNNARHMTVYSLPLLWFGCEGWARLRVGRKRLQALAWVAIAALAFDAAVVPASSDVTIYPSGNVPASYRDLARRQAEMRDLAQRMAARAAAGATLFYLGTTTTPYIQLYALESDRGVELRHAGVVTTLAYPSGGRLVFHGVFSGADYLSAAARARPAVSLEYDARGRHLWFFGEEWTWLPLHRRWYFARASLALR